MQGDPTTYEFLISELQYEALGGQQSPLHTGKEASGDCCAQLKEEPEELKQKVNNVVGELWKLKVQPAEPKAIVDTRKCQVVLDFSVQPIVLGFIGVLIGVIVAGLWK